jgi:hypothetical protein
MILENHPRGLKLRMVLTSLAPPARAGVSGGKLYRDSHRAQHEDQDPNKDGQNDRAQNDQGWSRPRSRSVPVQLRSSFEMLGFLRISMRV